MNRYFEIEGDLTMHPVLVPIYEHYVIDEGKWRFQYSASPDIREGWKRSGISFFAFTSSHPDAMPIYQYHAEDPWRYQYSKDPDIQEGWIKGDVAFYACTFEHPDTVPIHQYSARDPWRYQYRSLIIGTHPITGSGWLYEGVAFYCFAASSWRLTYE